MSDWKMCKLREPATQFMYKVQGKLAVLITQMI